MERYDQETEKVRITDIHCPNCGAPAKFDILQQKYLCAYCGGKVEISEACSEKQGFRKIQAKKLKDEVGKFRLVRTNCSGCGATVVFEESEALSNCAFCGRSLVRSEYLDTDGLPEYVIPFALTEEEAGERLKEWCDKNSGKAEAKHLRPLLKELKGFYLPYELVRGPVHMTVSRMDGGGNYPCDGFINDEFVNRSKQLDNLLLDGMEPFDTEQLTEFDFAYVAGHRVKISDITDQVLESRVREETAESYTPAVRKTLETKAVSVRSDVSSALRLPVLLPVYYISKGDLMAAVNGQTGKVSVRAEKESHYYFLPWWLKAILATLIVCLLLFAALCCFGMNVQESLIITGALGVVFITIMLCLYSDTVRNSFSVESGREIFTSGEKSFHREQGKLVLDDRILERKTEQPVFTRMIKGKKTPVILRFTTPGRVLKMALLCFVGLFLPVLLALLINGFDFSRLELGGSAVWFCIAVPIVPVYLIKFGIVELYEKPLVYVIDENGRKKLYKERQMPKIDKEVVGIVLRALFIPPVSLAVWFGIICFFVMVYLTAFGFD